MKEHKTTNHQGKHDVHEKRKNAQVQEPPIKYNFLTTNTKKYPQFIDTVGRNSTLNLHSLFSTNNIILQNPLDIPYSLKMHEKNLPQILTYPYDSLLVLTYLQVTLPLPTAVFQLQRLQVCY
jgi:hypothetical protein